MDVTMPNNDQELETTIQSLQSQGVSDDDIGFLVKQYDTFHAQQNQNTASPYHPPTPVNAPIPKPQGMDDETYNHMVQSVQQFRQARINAGGDISKIPESQKIGSTPEERQQQIEQDTQKEVEKSAKSNPLVRGALALESASQGITGGISNVAQGTGQALGGLYGAGANAIGGNYGEAGQDLVKAGEGVLKAGAGAVQTGFSSEPLGAEFNALTGAFSPEIHNAISSVAGTETGQYIASKWNEIPDNFKEDLENLAMILPLAKGGARDLIGEGLKNTVDTISKPVSAVAKGASELPLQALGKATGTSADTIKTAIQESASGSPEYAQALRGGISPESTLQDVQGALENMKQAKREAYGEGYDKLIADTTPQNIDDIKRGFAQKLADNNVGLNEDGTLNFSQSKLRDSSQGITELQNTYNDLKNWKDTTPAGLDILKQRVQQGWLGKSNSGLSDTIHTDLANQLKNKITESVPEYADMMKNYQAITNQINEVTKTLSLGKGIDGKGTAQQTAITKLASSLRDNFPMRKNMLDVLEKYSGKNLKAQIAGQSLSPLLPRGLIGMGEVGAGFLGYFHNPAFWGAVAISSPRVVGEIANAIGVSVKFLKDTAGKIAQVFKRTPEVVPEENPISNTPVEASTPNTENTNTQPLIGKSPDQKSLVEPKSKFSDTTGDIGDIKAGKEEQALIDEAKKFNSADEFIKAQGEPVYHGTDAKFNKFDISKSGINGNEVKFSNTISVSPNKKFASKYGKNLIEAFISPDAKIINYENIKNEPKYDKFLNQFLKNNPNKGIAAKEAFARKYFDIIKYGENEYAIMNPNKIKTKYELTDIWNKANGK